MRVLILLLSIRQTVMAFMLGMLAIALPANTLDRTSPSTADHRQFKQLQGPFATGPDVTKACLSCHTEAAQQLQQTTHRTWEFEHPETGQMLGKRHVVNSFCGAASSNEDFCSACHIGYGWDDIRQASPSDGRSEERRVGKKWRWDESI